MQQRDSSSVEKTFTNSNSDTEIFDDHINLESFEEKSFPLSKKKGNLKNKQKAEPIIMNLKEGQNQIGRTEIQKLQAKHPNYEFESSIDFLNSMNDNLLGKKKTKLSRNQILITIQKGLLYHHATVQLLGTNPSVLQRINETGFLERFYMEKNKIYVMNPGDVIYLLKGLYPLRLEEIPLKMESEPTQPEQTQMIEDQMTKEETKNLIKVAELDIKSSDCLEIDPFEDQDLCDEDDLDETDAIQNDNNDLNTLLATENSFDSEEDVVKLYKLLRKQARHEKKQMKILKEQLKEFSKEIEQLKVRNREGIEALSIDPNRPRTRSIEGMKQFHTSHSPEHQLEKSRPHLKGSGELILPLNLSNISSKSLPSSPSLSPSTKRKSIKKSLAIQPNSLRSVSRQSRSFTALQPLGTGTLVKSPNITKPNSRPKYLSGQQNSFSVPICPAIRVEVKKVVQFQMTNGLKQQLVEIKRLQDARKMEGTNNSQKTL